MLFETEQDALSFLQEQGAEIESADELWDEYGMQIERSETCN